MKSTPIIVGLLVVVLLGGVGLYALRNRTSPTSQSVDQPGAIVPTQNEAGTVEQGTRYLPFSPEVLAGTTTTRRVLFFYANWCPTCKPANEGFIENASQIPTDVTVIRVNYNDNDTDQAEKDLAQQYGITYQHTYVQIDEQGQEVTKWNGGGLDELLRNLK